jgi:hypothetical protein
MTLQTTPVARQQIPNTHQRTNWEAVFFALSVRQLRDATIELSEAVFSMSPVPRYYKQDTSGVQSVWASLEFNQLSHVEAGSNLRQ